MNAKDISMQYNDKVVFLTALSALDNPAFPIPWSNFKPFKAKLKVTNSGLISYALEKKNSDGFTKKYQSIGKGVFLYLNIFDTEAEAIEFYNSKLLLQIEIIKSWKNVDKLDYLQNKLEDYITEVKTFKI